MSAYDTAIHEQRSAESLRSEVFIQRDLREEALRRAEAAETRADVLGFALAMLVVLDLLAIAVVVVGVWRGWW